jgi:hypothetical protein
MRVREESANMSGPGHRSIGRKFVLKARQLPQAEFERRKLVEVAVRGLRKGGLKRVIMR